MKVGDLVRHRALFHGIGIVVASGWTANYVVVRWSTSQNRCHISQLEVVSESRGLGLGSPLWIRHRHLS